MEKINIIKKWLQNSHHVCVELPKEVYDFIDEKEPGLSFDDINDVAFIIHRFSEMPWTTQKEMLKELDTDKEDLERLNDIVSNNNFFQQLMLREGLGRKYWNTMIPYIKNGVNEKVVNYEYQYPFRLALFPGLSCMYYCGFCGRNQNAKYRGSVMKEGNQRFKDIISNMPKHSTLSISGGLEPLTNSGLSDIISHAKSEGVRVPLITNGHMLTSKYLQRNPGIWDLDSLRISLYGVDEESTYFVTRHKKAYQLVKSNMIEFLKLRNENNPDLKFGLNYIILPENIDTLLGLLDYVNEVNSQVDNGRGVDFITIREDFGSVTEINDDVDKSVEGRKYHLEGLMTDKQRTQLINVFKEFNERKDKECPDIHVDFGYAMVALGDGVLGQPLVRVSGEEMRKSGYPQMSVAIDSLGDIFLYREAGFLDRPGNQKFVAGRIGEKDLEETLRDFIESRVEVDRKESDSRFMDSYDHLMTLLVNQTESDMEVGIRTPFRIELEEQEGQISNNWYKD